MSQTKRQGGKKLLTFGLFIGLVLALAGLVLIAQSWGGTYQAETRPQAATTPGPGATPTAGPEQTPDESTRLFSPPLFDWTLGQWIDIGISLLIFLIIAIFGGRIIIWLGKWIARRTHTVIDDRLFSTARRPLQWLGAIFGFQVAYTRLDFLDPTWQQALDHVSFILYVIGVSAIVWILIDYGLTFYRELAREKDADMMSIDRLLPLVRTFAKGLLVVVSSIIVLNYLGIEISAAVAALGLTGFALSLAGKDTLTNLISGVIIAIDRPFRIGDRIYSNEVGGWVDVVEIGLRSTKVHTRDNRMVVIPNAQLADDAVINYNYPDRSYRLQVDIGVAYDTAFSTARQVLHDAVRQVEGVMSDRPVQVLFVDFGKSAMVFRVRWWIADYADMRQMNDRVYQAIQEALDAHGIVSSGL
jgi:small-conductance mechanosensitive channel